MIRAAIARALIVCCRLAHTGDAYQGQPLPAAAGLPTHARWRDQQLTWAKASLCEAFVREHGRARGQPWVAGAIACMDDWCRVFADALERKSGPDLLAAKAWHDMP